MDVQSQRAEVLQRVHANGRRAWTRRPDRPGPSGPSVGTLRSASSDQRSEKWDR